MSTLVLDSTVKTIKVSMSGAPATTNPDFTVSYADNNGTTFTEGASDGALTGATDAIVVSAPASGYRRIIKGIFIENKDTAPVTITVKYDNNATQRTIAKVTLNVGDTWSTDGTFDTYGSLKQTVGTVNLANVTGTLAVANGGTGITSFGTGVATWLGTPSSANLASAITDETGSGSLVFGTSPTLGTPTVNGYTEGVVTANTTTAYTISIASAGVQILTLTGNCTYTFPTATAGKSFMLLQLQDATGSRTVTWPSSVKWPSGTAPTITSTASKGDKFVFTADGTYWWGSVAGQNYL